MIFHTEDIYQMWRTESDIYREDIIFFKANQITPIYGFLVRKTRES